MRVTPLLFILFVCLVALQALLVFAHTWKAELATYIKIDTPIPGYRCYRGYSFTVEAMIRNSFRDPVNICIEPSFWPLRILDTNYTETVLAPGAQVVFQWVLRAPRSIGFGNYTLGFNITYTINSTAHSMYRKAWVIVIPRNVTLLVADLQRNATKYYLVIRNPLRDPGQYIVDNITVSITAYNVSVTPKNVFVKTLYANSSYMIPLTISFNESDIGALMVNITTHDDVHGLVYFNYTFFLVNATAYLNLRVINDYGEPLPGAAVRIAGETYSADSDGCVSLVLPVGIYNYTVKYHGHKVSRKIALYTGLNQYTIVVDLTPPTIVVVKQEGYGILVKAYDPGSNCSGVSSIIFVQGGKAWKYVFHAQRNVSLVFYPPLKSGSITVLVIDAQGNKNSTAIQYIEPVKTGILTEIIIVFSIVFIALSALLLLTSNYW
ncbi:MAG: carboxypeptidase regulatory-like domain-containing protein [Crenarchaeota archaeon]|nr:carboxypeptidase regulatory-like domain-containing protein [Thermoproteota archaeon]